MSLAFMGFSGLVKLYECYLDCRCRREPAGPGVWRLLGYASRRFAVEDDPVVEKITKSYRRASVVSAVIPAVAPTGSHQL